MAGWQGQQLMGRQARYARYVADARYAKDMPAMPIMPRAARYAPSGNVETQQIVGWRGQQLMRW